MPASYLVFNPSPCLVVPDNLVFTEGLIFLFTIFIYLFTNFPTILEKIFPPSSEIELPVKPYADHVQGYIHAKIYYINFRVYMSM